MATLPALHARFAAGEPGSDKVSEWLRFIWKMGEVAPGIATGEVVLDTHFNASVELAERYPDFNVLFRRDKTVSIVPTTDRGVSVMAQAADALGLYVGQDRLPAAAQATQAGAA